MNGQDFISLFYDFKTKFDLISPYKSINFPLKALIPPKKH